MYISLALYIIHTSCTFCIYDFALKFNHALQTVQVLQTLEGVGDCLVYDFIGTGSGQLLFVTTASSEELDDASVQRFLLTDFGSMHFDHWFDQAVRLVERLKESYRL